MHVLFVSACEKRAIKRSRAVLDSYALRTGEKAWASPMTQEGLREIRAALKASATRQTAVACYRNEGRQRMKLLWVVGSRRAFGPNGHFPVGTRLAKTAAPVPRWARAASLLAQAAGWCHDLGKASVLFQDKLRQSGPVKDCVRHEWVSMRLAQAMRQGMSWEDAWALVGRNENWLRDDPFEHGIHTAWDALDYLVVTHHRLLGPTGKNAKTGGLPDHSQHFSDERLAKEKLKPQAALSSDAFDTAKRLMARVEKLAEGADHRYWRAVAGIARAGLILADHEVSADDHVPKDRPAPVHALYANTNQDRQLNQELFGHLQNVANTAADKVYRIATLRLPGLSEEALESICEAAEETDFVWQNQAATALESLRERRSQPVLLFNMASTGSGKTRMNARAACVLSSGPVRFAVALNLRTLTLQTGDALRGQLHIGADELACVIGDKVAQRLHESGKPDEDEDGNPPEAEFESSPGEFFLPGWLEPLTKPKPVLRAVLGAPVLVSTVDYLIAAGMPQRQGHHASALLRLADSDLVLDEVDGYDPKPLVAVLHLVQWAALFGRNVICSTATLAPPVAAAIFQAYQCGAALRGAMSGEAAGFACALIDNYAQPQIVEDAAQADFSAVYQRQIDAARPKFGGGLRVAYVQEIEQRCLADWQQAVRQAVLRLHEAQAWQHGPTGKRISFGLVRVANIAPAIETARFLAATLPQARVACYHSRDFVIQRFLKERELDRLLTRKPNRKDPAGNARIVENPDLTERLCQATTEDVIFIVVATPVEEIGRDHDFDWAVIDPSSVRSIVQTAGRVNRHRKVLVASPNIALLQYNYKAATSNAKIVFTQPGFEIGEENKQSSHDSHNLQDLLNPGFEAVHAGLLFDGHRFAVLDNASIAKMLENPLQRLFQSDNSKAWWVNQGIYEAYPLRDNERNCEFMYTEDGDFKLLLQEYGKPPQWVKRTGDVATVPKIANDWLAWSPEELFDYCRELELAIDQGMRYSVRDRSDVGCKHSLDWSFGAC